MESEIEASNELNVGNAASGDKRKVVVAPPRKAEQVRFNKQGSSENSKWLKTSRQNLTKEQQNDDWRRKKSYLSFRREETEKNRQHEFVIDQIYANTLQP